MAPLQPQLPNKTMKHSKFSFRALAVTGIMAATAFGCAPLYAPTPIAQAQAAPSWQTRDTEGGNLLVAADFADDEHGWAVGIRSIFRTRNGGRDWSNRWDGGEPAVWFNSVAALAPDVAVVAGYPYGRTGGGSVLRTTDGGQSWQKLAVGNPTASFHSLQFRADGKVGYLISTLDGLMKTTDSGLTWSKVKTPHDVRLASIATRGVISLPDEKTIYVGANDSVLLHSGDDGANWDKIALPAEAKSAHKQFFGVRFADAVTGWANPYGKEIWETRDGGKSWKISEAPGLPYFTDAQNGWAASKSEVSQTTDGGKSWTNPNKMNLVGKTILVSLASNSRRLFAVGGSESAGPRLCRRPPVAWRQSRRNRRVARADSGSLHARRGWRGDAGYRRQKRQARA